MLKYVPLIVLLIFIPLLGLAKQLSDTIYDTKIPLEDEIHKKILLEMVPKWTPHTIGILFKVYSHPENYQLPKQDINHFNMQFIHAFWGPLRNPFNRYPRPAKIFIFLQRNTERIFYIAPIIQNSDNNNYYVFDKNQSAPFLLNDWINYVKTTNKNYQLTGFNICNYYGNLPTDSCTNKNYQSEATDIIPANVATPVKIINEISAYRAPNEDWRNTLHYSRQLSSNENDTIEATSIPWDNINKRNYLLNNVPVWQNLTIIRENFQKIRDMRFYDDKLKTGFLRRLSWLYPKDGCFSRAAAVNNDYFGPLNNNETQYFQRPAKIFAFGNLCVNTSNSPNGKETWGFHVAPIIRDSETNQTYVLDPSVDANHPLPVAAWIQQISAHDGKCASEKNVYINSFNICNGYGSFPADRCNNVQQDFSYEKKVVLGQDRVWLRLERERQEDLGRDPDKVLGDNPPWSGVGQVK